MWFSLHAGLKAAGTPVGEGSAVSRSFSLARHGHGLTNDQAFACTQLFGKVDLVARRVLDEISIGELVAGADEGGRGGVEQAAAGGRARQRQTAEGGRHG